MAVSKKAAAEKAEKVVKEVVKAAETVEKKVEAKKPEAEKAVKEAAVKATATAKKAASTAKKTVKKFEPKKTTVVFEANGKSYSYDDVVKAVNKACKGKSAKKLEIYVNANEGAAYYVLDGEASADNKIEL